MVRLNQAEWGRKPASALEQRDRSKAEKLAGCAFIPTVLPHNKTKPHVGLQLAD